MIVCDSCKREVGDDMGFCPFCGADLPPADEASGQDKNGQPDNVEDKEEES
jgi:rRNA maturation endonuclease Nob1